MPGINSLGGIGIILGLVCIIVDDNLQRDPFRVHLVGDGRCVQGGKLGSDILQLGLGLLLVRVRT